MKENQVLTEISNGIFSDFNLRAALQFEGDGQKTLFELAQKKRSAKFPEEKVQVRSVIEISNICRQKCKYCAIGGKSQKLNYTLSAENIEMLGTYLYNRGRRNLLLQSGENVSQEFTDSVAKAVKNIKKDCPDLKIILCMGDLSKEQYQKLFDAGASHYILKFESSDEKLFSFCKPNDSFKNRMECIENLIEVGFKVGSGNIVGLPGQNLDILVRDLKLVHSLPLAMNSTTIFIPAENSAFEKEPAGNPVYTLNMMALLRIMNPHRLMPTTSSLEKMIPDGQFIGLKAGANTITVHDGTPEDLQQYFPIYSSKRVRPQTEHFKDILKRAGMTAENIL